jgi:hypothetical protein
MAITGTRTPNNAGTKQMRNFFVNNCTIESAEQIDSPYHDCSVHIKLTDTSNGYNYNLFVNQNFEKDIAGVVTELKYPDNLNVLHVSSGTELEVSDAGKVNLTPLVGKDIAVINYLSNGKYKKQIWQTTGSINDPEALQAKFEKSVEAGYPKDFIGYTSNAEEVNNLKAEMLKAVTPKSDGMPF